MPRCLFLHHRACLETNAEQWKRLQISLQDLLTWMNLKNDELRRQMPIGGDVPTVHQQNDVHRVSETQFLLLQTQLRKCILNVMNACRSWLLLVSNYHLYVLCVVHGVG